MHAHVLRRFPNKLLKTPCWDEYMLAAHQVLALPFGQACGLIQQPENWRQMSTAASRVKEDHWAKVSSVGSFLTPPHATWLLTAYVILVLVYMLLCWPTLPCLATRARAHTHTRCKRTCQHQTRKTYQSKQQWRDDLIHPLKNKTQKRHDNQSKLLRNRLRQWEEISLPKPNWQPHEHWTTNAVCHKPLNGPSKYKHAFKNTQNQCIHRWLNFIPAPKRHRSPQAMNFGPARTSERF